MTPPSPKPYLLCSCDDRTEWCSGFDGDPAQAVQTRNKLFDQLEADGLLAAICHFPDPGFGKLVRLQGKRVWQAL